MSRGDPAPGRAAALEKLRTRRRRIADADAESVIARVRASGLDSLIEPWLTAGRGRPATLSGTALMAGMFLVAADNSGTVQLTAR